MFRQLKTSWVRLSLFPIPALLLVLTVAVACSNNDPTATPAPVATPQQPAQPDPAAPANTPLPASTARPADTPARAANLSGEIVVDGSSTVYPITVAAAEEFRQTYNDVQVSVGVSGTGGGFKKFAAGDTAISDASRPIKDGEREEAASNGIQFIELAVAYDGLSVMVNTRNDFVQCLTTDELNRIWMPESPVTTWRDVRGDWPDEMIRLYGPDSESGTFDYFTEEITGDTGLIRQDFVPAVDDNVLVQGIAGDRYSLGYFGYAYYAANTDKLKLVAVDSGTGCILPSEITINDGSYSPLSRPLFIYVNIDALERPEVKAFVEFYMQNGASLASSVGYVGLPQSMYNEALALVANPVPDVQ